MSDSAPSIVGGVYEAAFGVPDLAAGIGYWQRFGYRVIATGKLARDGAKALYGVDSALASVRLGHQSADHGLVRLMAWERPLGAGLALTPFRGLGSRWVGTKTLDMTRVHDHVEQARAKGAEIFCIPPFFVATVPADRILPFHEPLVGVREMTVVDPLWRRVFLEFVGYEMPMYGQVDPHAMFQTSQFTHVCLVHQDDTRSALRFYDETLGMKRASEVESTYERAIGGRKIFELAQGENFHVIDFDDPRSGNTLADRRSGRLKIIRFQGRYPVADRRALSGPGNLGLSLYTAFVKPIAAMQAKVAAGGATRVTAVTADEFGGQAFSCLAPDGYAWTFLAAQA